MKRYKRMLVCLDRSEHDPGVLAYASGRSRLAQSEDVHFLHVAGEPAAADGTPMEAPTPADMTGDVLDALARKHFEGHGQERLVFEVVRGSRLIETLRYAHDKDIDVILVGRHFGRAGAADDEALLARRITRKATCSVLVLPEDSPPTANAILVPVRDSDCSAGALEVACGIASATGAAVTALNIFRVSAGYSRVGTSLEEHQSLLEAGAEGECAHLLEKVDTHGVEVECRCVPDLHANPVPIILDTIASGPPGAVVIGARGRTGAAGVLLGTVTEQLIRWSPVPVLAVKKKGECIGIVRALLTLAGQE